MVLKKLFLAIAVVALSAVNLSCDDYTKVYTESSSKTANVSAGTNISTSRQNALTKAIERCRPAIVGINVTEVRQVVYRNPFFDSPFSNDDPFFQRFRQFFGGGNRTREYKVQGLGSGFLIGHSFFCNANSENERKWFENIVKFEIRPLLEEYWFDDNEKVSANIEEYLKIIYQLSGNEELVKTTSIAKSLSIAPGSVTPML